MGCMAQKDQEIIFKRAPYVDLVVGPGQLHTIPDLLDKVRSRRGQADGGFAGPQGRLSGGHRPQP